MVKNRINNNTYKNWGCRSLGIILTGVSALALLTPIQALAQETETEVQEQDAAKAKSKSSDNTILVTARKRAESTQEIPESVSVITAATLEQNEINNIDDVGLRVTNLNMSTRADGNPNVTIRGVGSFGNTLGVGFFIDGVQIFTDASAEFGEIERLEVLKGPQGTLYGGSNIGGAIKFVTKRPDLNTFEGYGKVRAGEQNLLNLSGSVNVPLGGIGALRLFGYRNEDDGFVYDRDPTRLNGRSNLEDGPLWPLPLEGAGTQYVPDSGNSAEIWRKHPNEREEWGLRGSALFELSPDIEVYLTARYNKLDGGNNNWRADDPGTLTYSRERDLTFAGRLVRKTFGVSGEVNWNLGGVEATYLTSYTDAKRKDTTDLDVSSEVGFDLVRPEWTKVFTHEFRLTSDNDSNLEWIVGGYRSVWKNDWSSYANFYGTTDVLSAVIPPSDTLNILDGVVGDPVFAPTFEEETTVRVPFPFENRYREKKHWAAFGTATLKLGAIELGVGLRIDDWSSDTLDRNADLYATGVPYLKQGGTEVLPKASISYFLPSGTHIYANYAKGFEPGGYNLYDSAGTPLLNPYFKETVDNYEIGFKTMALDRRLSFNAAVYYIDYSDRQFELQQQIAIGGVVENILNAGSSTQYGVEADANFRANDWLTLTAGFGRVWAEFGKGSLVNDVNSQPSDVSGKTPPWISDYSFSLAGNVDVPISDTWDLVSSAEFLGKGPYWFNQENTAKHPGYELVNFSIGVENERYTLRLNVENVFDKGYYSDGSIWPGDAVPGAPRDVVIGTLGQPRIVTVSAIARF